MSIYKLSLKDKSGNSVYFKTTSDAVTDTASNKTLDTILGSYNAAAVGDGSIFGIIGGTKFKSVNGSDVTGQLNNIGSMTLQNAFSNGLCANALLVSATSATDPKNYPMYVTSGSTTNLPAPFSYGIRLVFWYSASSIIVKLIGADTSNRMVEYSNRYNGTGWDGWTKQLNSNDLGSTDISSIGDGTISGTIRTLNKMQVINAVAENGVLTDALNISTTSATSSANYPMYVNSTKTTINLPSDCALGIRTVKYYSDHAIWVEIDGINNANKYTKWVNYYNGSDWLGWQERNIYKTPGGSTAVMGSYFGSYNESGGDYAPVYCNQVYNPNSNISIKANGGVYSLGSAFYSRDAGNVAYNPVYCSAVANPSAQLEVKSGNSYVRTWGTALFVTSADASAYVPVHASMIDNPSGELYVKSGSGRVIVEGTAVGCYNTSASAYIPIYCNQVYHPNGDLNLQATGNMVCIVNTGSGLHVKASDGTYGTSIYGGNFTGAYGNTYFSSQSGAAIIQAGSGKGCFFETDTDSRSVNRPNSAFMPMYASAFTIGSSKLIKENISDIDDDDANKILSLRPVSFDYKKMYGGAKGKRGLIAEELELVYPFAVNTPEGYNEDDFDESLGISNKVKTVDYSSLIPDIIKLIQIQNAQIKELQSRN